MGSGYPQIISGGRFPPEIGWPASIGGIMEYDEIWCDKTAGGSTSVRNFSKMTPVLAWGRRNLHKSMNRRECLAIQESGGWPNSQFAIIAKN